MGAGRSRFRNYIDYYDTGYGLFICRASGSSGGQLHRQKRPHTKLMCKSQRLSLKLLALKREGIHFHSGNENHGTHSKYSKFLLPMSEVEMYFVHYSDLYRA